MKVPPATSNQRPIKLCAAQLTGVKRSTHGEFHYTHLCTDLTIDAGLVYVTFSGVFFFVFYFCQAEIVNKHEKDVEMTSSTVFHLSGVNLWL